MKSTTTRTWANQGVNILLEVEINCPILDVLFSLAFGYYKMKNFGLTFKYITKCTKLDPSNRHVQVLLAKYYKKRGELNKSLEILLQIAESDSVGPEVNYLIAEIYRLKKFANNAADYYDRVRSLLPDQSYLSRVVTNLKNSVIQV